MAKTDLHEQIKHIGEGVLRIVAASPDPIVIGQLMDDLLDAALKAPDPGDQTDEQIADLKAKARKAFARKLARRVKKLASG